MKTMTVNRTNTAATMHEEHSSAYSIKGLYRKVRVWFFRKIGIAGSLDPYQYHPKGDLYFSHPENIQAIKDGVEQIKRGECKTYTAKEIRESLGL
ncbi:hypothetical protein EZS27_002720 [termite gut metagenome]|uniref:Uncharacterized protein n=1 Tax=termite gut metagenome TaxID=433724 RepID=A0A5J4SUQ9_9ZZZZ